MTESSEEGLFPDNEERMDQLLALGYIDAEIEFCGVSYGLRTLTGEEELIAGLVAKPYLESFGQLKAWAWANVAMALTHVNSDSDFCPATGSDGKAYAHARFRFITREWFWPLGEFLFEEFKKLEAERDALIEILKGKSERSPQNSIGSRDFSTERADSMNLPEMLALLDED